MNKQTALCIVLSLCLLSCAHLPQKGGEQTTVTIPEWYDSDSLRADYLYTEGVRVAAQEGNDSLSLPYFEQVLRIDSMHAPTHFQLASFYDRKDPHKSLHHSTIALRSDSNNVDYLQMHSYALVGVGDIQAAKVGFEKLLRKDPKNPYNYRAAAMLYAATRMPHMAITTLDSAEQKLGRIKELSDYKRELLISVGLHSRAIEEAEAAIANNPSDPDNYLFLGRLYDHLSRTKGGHEQASNQALAFGYFTKAVEVAPNNIEAQLELGDFCYRAGYTSTYLDIARRLFLNDEVAKELKIEMWDQELTSDIEFYRTNFFTINSLISILQVKYPGDFEVMKRYAIHLTRAGEIEKSLQVYKTLLSHPTSAEEAFFNVIAIEDYLGRRDSAMLYLDRAIELFPKTLDFYWQKGSFLLSGEHPDEQGALKLFKKAVKMAPDSLSKSSGYVMIAGCHADPNKRYRNYAKAIAYNPDNALALNNWAYELTETGGDLDRALEMSKRACELQPTNPTYLDTKAWVHFLRGELDEAKRIMKQAISLDSSGDSTLLLHYADILAAEGNTFMAELYYKRALEAGEPAELIEKRIEALKAAEQQTLKHSTQ